MAEVVLGAFTESLVSMAFSLATEELSLVWSFKDDLENLAGELKMIQALIAEADRKNNIQSEPLQLWMKRLKSVAFDVEDVLEEYQYELLRRKIKKQQKKWHDKVRCFFPPMKKLAFRLDIGRKIKDVNQKLKNVKDQAKDYGLTLSEISSTRDENKIMDHPKTSPSVQETEIVGRDNDVKQVVDMLLNANKEENLAVIGIVGMGGQGKTTLAQLIYNNDKVVNHFQQKIWVCVSDDFNIETILNEMVQYVSGENLKLTNRGALIKRLQTLKDKNYLLVLDDVWNEDQGKWEDMKKDLLAIGGSTGSKIMVTTRKEKVVSIMHASHTHHLSKLSDGDSWALFRNRAFANGGTKENPDMVEIGQRMVERCGGMPLAIKTLGGLLYSKKNIIEWLNIEKSDIWSSSNSEEGVLPSIKLSYNHLSSPSLKQCFAYCSIFPKDHVIYREDLVQLWMAQGFLNPPKGSPIQMEELGYAYFNTLLWNSLLQEPKYDCNNEISCKMHDIVHDFASRISKDYCFTMKVKQDNKNIDVVHLSVISKGGELVDLSQGICSKLKTLYLFHGVVRNELIKCKSLRTLVLGDFSIQELPISICKLKQLRYLDIERFKIKAVPACYVKLYNLQTLKLDMEEGSSIFLGSLINLRHIGFRYAKRGHKLVGINKLIHLQTLPYFTVEEKDGCKIEELGPLNNLRGRLIIYGLEKVKDRDEAQKAYIIGKPKVDHLELCWPRMREGASELWNDEDVLEGLRPHSYLKQLTIRDYRGSRFPSWMTNVLLQNLVEFTLEGCDSCEQFPAVDHLPSLRSLRIERCKKLVALPSLQDCTSLETLRIMNVGVDSISNMPLSLRLLRIDRCKKLVALPSLQGCTSLERLMIWDVGVDSISNMPLSLRLIRIERCENLVALPSLQGCTCLESLMIWDVGVDYISNMPSSLRELSIEWCGKLEALPSRCFELCTSLTSINIKNCGALAQGVDDCGLERLPNLEYLSIGELSKELDYFPWPPDSSTEKSYGVDAQLYFPSLKELKLSGWPKLTSLPDQLQYLPSLSSLDIWSFDGLKALPEWLGSIQSLQSLHLNLCNNIEYLPSAEAMQRLTNLQRLEIYCCPLLRERCTQGSRPEWNKIAHIRDIKVDHQAVTSLS